MADTIQVQSCERDLNAACLNKDIPPESSNLGTEKDELCGTKKVTEIQNTGGDGMHMCNTSVGDHANGDKLPSKRKATRKNRVISYNNMFTPISSEDQNVNEYKSEGKCGANSDITREPVRKIVLKSMEDMHLSDSEEGKRNSRSIPPSDSSMKKSNSQTKLDFLTETTKMSDKPAIHTVGDRFSGIVHVKVDQTNKGSTRCSGPAATEQAFGSETAAISNVSNLKTAENCCNISNTSCSEPNNSKNSLLNKVNLAPLPPVPEQPSFQDSSAIVGDSSGSEYYGGTESKISTSKILKSYEESTKRLLLGEAGVQTSFVSSHSSSCNPENCPRRKRKVPKDLVSRDVQTEKKIPNLHVKTVEPIATTLSVTKSKPDTSLTTVKSKPETSQHPMHRRITISTIVKFSIPPKRSRAMEDRLLRRIMYFDSNQTSVCNKDVEFCTYRIHRSSKTVDPHKLANNKLYRECRSGKKCVDAISKQPGLSCDEVVIQVVSLNLTPHAVNQLLKACNFIYIDYVFLGHVGNETFLAPVSSTVYFDSRRSYCVSMKFNRKERSLLKEQVNPTGLLAKDCIMFILVCHAAPEFDILKNWDYAYGYLSMKSLMEQTLKSDYIDYCKFDVEITRIGSTEKIGVLHLIFEGLQLVKRIRDEDLECIEPRPGVLFQKLAVDKTDIKDIKDDQE
ncbi:hypothetical protein GE061_005718 [Apolygus lucorum]|uniref:RPGRIP1 C-terminal domain-containing protein n=1 Tax=Apolygus lucorum TaxID=248454 RepID=A0A6A4IUL9_APOLU|nr:hypothetical protein GE061_005718 [Apolygus lucorum]